MIECILVLSGAAIALASDIYLVGWKNTLKLWFYMDSITPVQIALEITFHYMMKELQPWNSIKWMGVIVFPIYIIYLPGNLRVNVKFAKWGKWRVLFYKATMILTGCCSFYIGFMYLRGAYKISLGFLPQLQLKLKNLIILYVFGLA